MTNHFRLVLTLAVATAVGATNAAAQTSVKSLQVSAEPVEAGIQIVLENHGVLPADGWHFRVRYLTTRGQPVAIGLREDMLRAESSESYGPIQPSATRTVLLPVSGGVGSILGVEILLVVFSDGTAEGSNEAKSVFFKNRALEGSELEFWAAVLEEASRLPSQTSRRLIAQRLQERQQSPEGKLVNDAFAKAVRGDVQNLLNSPDNKLSAALSRRASRFAEQARGPARYQR